MNTMTLDKQNQHTSQVSWQAPVRIGKVALTVRDLAKVSEYYQQVIGLKELGRDGKSALLGAGSLGFLELRQETGAALRPRREAGLFHTAFLLPTRAHLASWVQHIASNRMPIQGASDHLVSEAFYLADPEGNGIEVYIDRPSSEWMWSNGSIKMATEHLDVDGLLAAGSAGPWKGAPDGTFVGHIHLQVGDLAQTEEFYGKAMGFDLVTRYPGANFFSTGGYHHHLGTNIWNSRGAGVHSDGVTGLDSFELVATSDASFETMQKRLGAAGANSTAIKDPWGTTVQLVKA